MRNIHPADELAMIRTDIRRLREREDFLRKGFSITAVSDPRGRGCRDRQDRKEQRLRQDKLPQHLFDDPSLWETKVTRHVHIDELRHGARGMPAFVSRKMNSDVIEHF